MFPQPELLPLFQKSSIVPRKSPEPARPCSDGVPARRAGAQESSPRLRPP